MTETSWHLDKRVPVSLIVTIVLQTFAFGWMAKSLDAKADANATAIFVINKELEIRRPVLENNARAVAVLSSQLEDIKASNQRIIDLLEKRERDR